MENEYYRGDTFVFPFSLQNSDGEKVNFEAGDVLKCGVKTSIYSDEYSLFQEITVENKTPEIQIKFLPDETRKLKTRKYMLELELTRNGDVETIFQQEVKVKGDVVRNDNTQTSS